MSGRPAGEVVADAGTAARVRSERRVGVGVALAGLAGCVAGMALGVRDGLHGHDYPRAAALLMFALGIAVYGAGMYRAQWPPSRVSGVPPPLRHLFTLLVCLATWFVLATVSGLVAAVLKDRALGG